jgi:hypothetical protein
MGLQVRALAQSLAGLGARVFNWSVGLNVAQRRDLSMLIMDYARPCSHIDESVENLAGNSAAHSGTMMNNSTLER